MQAKFSTRVLFVRQLLRYLVGDALHVLQLRRELARLVEFRGGECGGEAGAEPRGLAGGAFGAGSRLLVLE